MNNKTNKNNSSKENNSNKKISREQKSNSNKKNSLNNINVNNNEKINNNSKISKNEKAKINKKTNTTKINDKINAKANATKINTKANTKIDNNQNLKFQNVFAYKNFLASTSPKFDFLQMNDKFPLTLAFIGDAVHTLFIRSYFIKNSASIPEIQHNLSSNFCRAKSQSEALDYLGEFFNEQEKDLAKRTRNVKNHNASKNTSLEDYKKATAFEAVIGYLYLTNQIERLQDLLLKFMEKK